MSWWRPPLWPAPAKLNLMLRILGRRDDGYHLLQTVFQFLDFGDAIEIRRRSDGDIRRIAGPAGVAESEDLVIRAARLLQRATGCTAGADISVHKNLPLGGGLGGGSSDAATTLVALNSIWGTGLAIDQIARLGLQLGADVPVFVRGTSAWAEGVGEKLSPLRLPEHWFLVVVPPVRVSTAKIFKDPELTRNSPPITIPDFVAGAVDNDCLPVVTARYPEVARALADIAPFGTPRLTGTGACVFCEFAEEVGASKARGLLPESVEAFVARGLNRSPLVDALSQHAMN